MVVAVVGSAAECVVESAVGAKTVGSAFAAAAVVVVSPYSL